MYAYFLVGSLSYTAVVSAEASMEYVSNRLGGGQYFIDKIGGSLFYKGSPYFIKSGHYSI